MVKLLRAVTTSLLYPRIRGELQSRTPDDVWYEPERGWMIVFPLNKLGVERLILCVVQPPSGQGRAELVKALLVERNNGGIQTELLSTG